MRKFRNKTFNTISLSIILVLFTSMIIISSQTVNESLSEEVVSIQTYSNQYSGLPTSGNLENDTQYTLTENVQLTNMLTVPEGCTVSINLNGYAIFAAEGRGVLSNKGTLTIIDEYQEKKIHYGNLGSIERVINRNNRADLYVSDNAYPDGKAWQIETVEDVIWDYEGTTLSEEQVPSGAIAVEGGIITGGYSYNGGAIYNNGGNLYLEGGTFIGNQAYRSTSTSLSSPVSEGHGGAIFTTSDTNSNGVFIMTGGTISYNCGDGSGGGVTVRAGTFIMKSGIIENNDTTASGGGVNAQGTSGRPEFILGADLTDTEWQTKYKNNPETIPVIRNNITRDTRSTGNGGGIQVQTADLTYNAGKIQENRSAGSGGGIYAYSGANVQAKSEYCIIENNYAGNSGGGIMQQYGIISLSGSIIKNNSAMAGGGINVRVGDFEMTNGVVSNNIARMGNGGGLSASAQNNISPHGDAGNLGCDVNIRGGTFEGNKCLTGNGGAIYISVKNSTEECNVDIVGGNFSNNETKNDGGAIYLEGGNLTISEETGLQTIVSGNKAGRYGGAAYITNMDSTTCYTKNLETNEYSEYFSKTTPGNAIISGGDFTNNTATSRGGAVYVSKGNFEFLGTGSISESSSVYGGAVYVSNGNTTINGGKINNCEATNGGGFYISGGDLNFETGTINGCKATAGGGIFIANGDVIMNGGTISNNQASEYGGAIYANSDSQNIKINITSGSIIGNIASLHGGGVGVNMGEGYSAEVVIGLETCNGLDTTHSHPIIDNNTANEIGGGFCLHGDSLSMEMYCGSINTNIAIKEPGSSNINQNGGVVKVHSGTVNGGITIIGGQYVYVPGNTSTIGVKYDANISGGTHIEQAEITSGIVISLPKTLFTREDYTLVGWSTVATPGDGDTIYKTGELYTVPNESVTLYAIWLRNGAGTIESPGIKSGKIYEEFSNGMNAMISCDASFTVVMNVLDMNPSFYKDRTISFSNSLKQGTKIIMIDISNENDRDYYYYIVGDDSITSIPLADFSNMVGTEKYQNPTIEDTVNEKFMFIVDLANCNNEATSTQMTLTRNSNVSDIAPIEQKVSYTTTSNRKFGFTWSSEADEGKNPTIGDSFVIEYEKFNPTGVDSRYAGRKMTLVIQGKDDSLISAGTKLYDGTNYYELNGNGQFIIPFGDVTESKSITLRIYSDSIIKNSQLCNIKAELWVSANSDDENPFMGNKVATLDDITFNPIPQPALKTYMNKRIYSSNEFNGKLALNYITLNLDNYDVTLEVQKKNQEGIYETKTNILSSVSKSVSNQNGVYTLDIDGNGTINIQFLEDTQLETGTYRILTNVMQGNEEIFVIPYNFMILE